MATDKRKRWGIIFVVILAIGYAVERSSETPAELAYRLCGQCGLDRAKVDQLIDDMAHSALDRDGLIELFEGPFEPEDDHKERCRPCVEAALDVAGRTED